MRSPVPSFSKRAAREYFSMMKGSAEKSGEGVFPTGVLEPDRGTGADCWRPKAFEEIRIAHNRAAAQRFIEAPKFECGTSLVALGNGVKREAEGC